MSNLITNEVKHDQMMKLVELALTGERFSYEDVRLHVKCGSPRDVMMDAREYFTNRYEEFGGNINHEEIRFGEGRGRGFREFFFEKGFEWSKQVQITGKRTEKSYVNQLECENSDLRSNNKTLETSKDYYKRRSEEEAIAKRMFLNAACASLLSALLLAIYIGYLITIKF